MPTNPVPLREALREAIYELVNAGVNYVEWASMDNAQVLTAAEEKADALLSQIPPDLEVNDAE
jgi:hypothetical protein